jgi:hypothetical protein
MTDPSWLRRYAAGIAKDMDISAAVAAIHKLKTADFADTDHACEKAFNVKPRGPWLSQVSENAPSVSRKRGATMSSAGPHDTMTSMAEVAHERADLFACEVL